MNPIRQRIVRLGVCLAMLLSLVRVVRAQMPSEEAIVRKAYAKLVYATKIGTIHDSIAQVGERSAAELEYQVAQKALKVELSEFAVGPITAIAQRPYADFVTKPAGEDVLHVSLGLYTSTEDLKEILEVRETSESGARAYWIPGQDLTEDWTVPFGQILKSVEIQNKTKYSRYASYKATVTYAGRSRTYKAMFLFGVGDAPIVPIDTVTNSPALAGVLDNSFYDKNLYPSVLLQSSLGRKPAVAGWLKSHQVKDPVCRGGQRQVCCDLTTLTCGPAEADVTSELSKPVSKVLEKTRPYEHTRRQMPESAKFVTVSMSSFSGRGASQCSDFNFDAFGATDTATDLTQHTSGNHGWHDSPLGSCAYQGGPQCIATSDVHSTLVSDSESGTTSVCHLHTSNYVDASATGNNPTATTNAAAAVVPSAGCAGTISITFSGTNPTYPPNNIWTKNHPYALTCPSHTIAGSPIVIDTLGQGFHLTSDTNGVNFDLAGTGTPVHVAWTDASYGNAFLALDRNGNGRIDSGKELFGNYTAQPQSSDPNGFLALAVFDSHASGGNEDGVIDEHDAIWTQLRLWIDENHDGISQPEELHSLPELGVYGVDLKYGQVRHYDQFGNLFRYKGHINPDGQPRHDEVDRKIFDVFLVVTPGS
jgi:hypothetical protein